MNNSHILSPSEEKIFKKMGGDIFKGKIPLIYKSTAIADVVAKVKKVAPFNSIVLIHGESGVGKEIIARMIHEKSDRTSKELIIVNCAGLSETLLSSELFGHMKGSFTGAIKDKMGRFEIANGGSIFLDEIGDISPNMQLKLLRVIQEGEFERVGGIETIKVDVRIICATNKNLAIEVKSGRFREDLFYRLNVIPIFVPPLRNRREDIIPIAENYIHKFCGENKKNVLQLDQGAKQILIKYSWPGNVRELQNMIERAVVFSSCNLIDEEIILSSINMDQVYSDEPAETCKNMENIFDPIAESLKDKPLKLRTELTEKREILKELKSNNNNKSFTAEKLGMTRPTLYKKLKKYDITVK